MADRNKIEKELKKFTDKKSSQYRLKRQEFYDQYIRANTARGSIISGSDLKKLEIQANQFADRKMKDEAYRLNAMLNPTTQSKASIIESKLKDADNRVSAMNINSNDPRWRNPEFVKQMITVIGKQQGLTDQEIAFATAIAAKETGGSFNVKSHNRGTAQIPEDSYGVFQINKMAHPDYKAGLDPIGNITYGVNFAANKLRQAKGDVKKAARNYNGSGPMAEKYSNDFIANYYPSYSNGIIGAAAPVPQSGVQQVTQGQALGDAMAELSQGALTQGEKIVEKYIKDAGYDTKLYKEIKDNKQKEIKEALDEIKSLPTTASAEELQAITNQYAQAKQDLNQAYNTAIAGIQAGIGADQINSYYNKLKEADDLRIKQMQEANPYTKMAKASPLDLSGYANAVNRQQQVNAMIRANNIAMGGQAGPVNFADERMQLAQARRAEELARQFGATPEEVIEGGLLDYKNMGTILNNQQQAMIQLIAAAQQGDRQAQQVLANMQVNQAINNNALTQNAITAQQAANAAALDRARFAAENARWGVQQGQNLDMYPITSDASIQAEKLQQTGNIMNSAANRGVNAAGNMLNYQAMLQKAATGGDASDDLKTFLSINNPELQAASQSPQIDALPNAIAARKEAIARNFPQYAGYVYPNAPTNSYAPIPNLTGFNVNGQNTFRPQQQ